MNTILRKFVDEPLFDACAALLNHLHISFNEVTRTPVPFEGLYPGPLSKALQEIMRKVEHTYFIGTVDEASLSGQAKVKSGEDVTQEAAQGRYTGMMVFAAEIRDGQKLTRTELATLTRGFNRIAAAQPVVLFIKQNDKLALATCERSEYTQQWRDGEKLGKVSLLRDINCEHPHRGHIDILESIGDKAYPTFEELYKHWMQVFSNELLTKKFYSELSDWYAWAVQVVRFPNDLNTTDDDEKFNHESCIRLITRLIFVWFLKQKHLIPEEFFDEDYIRDHFIENFDPHDRENMLYNPEKSKYYRLILQNLFFAMLNCPIVEEGKDTANNRKFRGDHQYGIKRDGYNVNNLMRYKADFKEGGADEFVQMANNNVPFLNGGLFDCLDDKPNKLYYDGFSERKESLEQLYLPDWLFFGEEVGRGIDLSQWYDDTKKRNVAARGIIDILKRYNFTIEENTPLDQEVSLDPELLGKAFENLLASYNPETKTSARKQTGSFYTPREIVQYMVDESLVAHLKRVCGDELVPQYRALLSYSTEETTLNKEQRRNIMQAIYHCRVLDPACGSGAFPMGMLQQMVHILRQLDPTNEMWKEFMIDIAIEQSRKAFNSEVEEERKARLADIEEAFNRHVNDPDYARKLYLIENCIYGVDIQPIAVQISKLRFFISLVVDQKPSNDAAHNFGIRPLPNLESKFVAANTLIPVEYDGTLVENDDDVIKFKSCLKELNHKIFLAKRNVDKQRLKNEIKATREALAQAIEDTGFVGQSEAELLAQWDMFDQNASSSYFDAEWMFGVKDGFDIVIGNPPYVDYRKIPDATKKALPTYESYQVVKTGSLYVYFLEFGLILLKNNGILVYINPYQYINADSGLGIRTHVFEKHNLCKLVDVSHLKVFESADTYTCINIFYSRQRQKNIDIYCPTDLFYLERNHKVVDSNNIVKSNGYKVYLSQNPIIEKIASKGKDLSIYVDVLCGLSATGFRDYVSDVKLDANYLLFTESKQIDYYITITNNKYIHKSVYSRNPLNAFKQECVFIARMTSHMRAALSKKNEAAGKVNVLYNFRLINNRYLLGLLNSKLLDYYYCIKNEAKHLNGGAFGFDTPSIKELPIVLNKVYEQQIVSLVDQIIFEKRNNSHNDTRVWESEIDRLVYHLYGLTYDEVLVIDPMPPFTREEYGEA